MIVDSKSSLTSLDNEVITGLVSIIMPAFNSANSIEASINSVLRQNFINWELIVIDDLSKDTTVEIVKKILGIDKRVKLIESTTNGGTARARNSGLKEAKGQYIAFLDSDDLWDVNYLESQIAFIKDNGPIIAASYRIKTTKNTIIYNVPTSRTYKQLLVQNTMGCLATMYDRSVIGEVYFEEDLLKHEDFALWLNILRKGYVAKGNQEILATYIIHENSKSYNKSKLIKPMYHIYRKNQGYNFIKSLWLTMVWGINGLKKYRKIR